jgi:hypothetical protein
MTFDPRSTTAGPHSNGATWPPWPSSRYGRPGRPRPGQRRPSIHHTRTGDAIPPAADHTRARDPAIYKNQNHHAGPCDADPAPPDRNPGPAPAATTGPRPGRRLRAAAAGGSGVDPLVAAPPRPAHRPHRTHQHLDRAQPTLAGPFTDRPTDHRRHHSRSRSTYRTKRDAMVQVALEHKRFTERQRPNTPGHGR